MLFWYKKMVSYLYCIYYKHTTLNYLYTPDCKITIYRIGVLILVQIYPYKLWTNQLMDSRTLQIWIVKHPILQVWIIAYWNLEQCTHEILEQHIYELLSKVYMPSWAICTWIYMWYKKHHLIFWDRHKSF